MTGVRIDDAGAAQLAAKRFLASQFGSKKIKDIAISRAWYSTGAQRDIWEVEGDIVVKTGWFSKEEIHFKFQIDPETGRVIAYEI